MNLTPPPAPASGPAGFSTTPALRTRRHPLAALLLAAPFAFAGTAQAATITVGDNCSLVDAITAANSDTAVSGCAAGEGADTIVIPPNRTTTLTAVNNDLAGGANGLPIIRSEIRIEANGNIIERSTAEGTPQFRLLQVQSGGELTVRNAVLRGGHASVLEGGAVSIAQNGKLRLDACTVTGNTAALSGGGIGTAGGSRGTPNFDIEIRDSLISNNTAPQGGGAHLNAAANTASRIVFSNVTVHGNVASSVNTTGGGGGLWIVGASTESAVLDHVTVTRNRAGNSLSNGGGAGLTASRASMKNSLICGNQASAAQDFDGALRTPSAVISLGGNLVGCARDNTPSYPLAFSRAYTPAASDLLLGPESATSTPIGSILEVDAAKFTILKDNGGPTQTVALVAGSPAINPVRSPTDDVPLRRDQRGYVPNGAATPSDTIRDIGAFEFEGIPAVAPAAPTALAATPGDASLTIAFKPGAAGSAPISNYAYALGDSDTFTALDPADGESPVTISGLSNGTAVTVRLKAISLDGESAASEPVSATPSAATDGACGSASGNVGTASAPTSCSLCETGTASAVTGSDGAWRWSCSGSGGGTAATCAAPYAKPTITLTANPTSISVGDEGSTVFASSTSGQKPALSSTTATVCALSEFAGSPTGTTMTATGLTAGTCTVKASLAGSGDIGLFRYVAADDQTVDISVAKGTQTITGFSADKTQLPVGGMTTLSAEGGASGNAVTFSSLSSEICFVSGSMVTALSAGTCTVAADQAGNDGYKAAAQATLDITVNKAAQLISGFTANPSSLKVGGMATLTASGGASGNAIAFRTTTSEVCSVSGAMVTALSAGSCALIASQAGNADFEAADEVSLTITVSKAAQLISGFTANPASIKVGETSELSAFGGASGKPIVFASTTGDRCSVSGSTVTALAAGTCTVTASQAGTADFDAAETVSLSITIEAAPVATGPALTLDMNDLDFGTGYLLRFRDIGVETTSEAEIVTLSNSGTAPLIISSITTTGDFRHTTTCGTSVAPGGTCTIAIRFSPTAVGTRTGETRIVSNAVTSPDRISLSGTGRGLKPAIKTNVSRFDFGRVKVGSTSREQTLVISSTGTGPLEIRSISVTGDYVGRHNCPRWLDAGKSCQVTGSFKPKATGVRSGAVSILSSVSNTPTQVTLTGTGF